MADYHTTYKGPEGETTQWDDLQRKAGNLPPLEPIEKPDPFAPEQDVVKNRAYIDDRDEDELENLEDDFADDRELEKYRQQRVEEMKQALSRPRFGSLEFIRAPEFTQKVTNASMDVWVVVLLFKEQHEGSQILTDCLSTLAGRFDHNKFVRMISTDCIVNYPDANVPTVLVYHEGKCVKTIVGLAVFGGKRASHEQVTLMLNQVGPICRKPGDDGDGEDPDAGELKSLVKRMVIQRQQSADEADEDSDFSD